MKAGMRHHQTHAVVVGAGVPGHEHVRLEQLAPEANNKFPKGSTWECACGHEQVTLAPWGSQTAAALEAWRQHQLEATT